MEDVALMVTSPTHVQPELASAQCHALLQPCTSNLTDSVKPQTKKRAQHGSRLAR